MNSKFEVNRASFRNPHCLRHLQIVEMVGPLVVGIDFHGKNLFEDVSAKVDTNKPLIDKKFGF